MDIKKAVYLKINRKEEFAYRNLSRWIDIAFLMNADCYILCDDDQICNDIKNKIFLYHGITFIKSNKEKWSKNVVEHIANRNWVNAAYAHLTTFLHAKENGYDKFWNIDADDTQICLSINRIVESLSCVEEYAELHKINCFSLDMWRTEMEGRHWSFGITYVDGKLDWKEIILSKYKDAAYRQIDTDGNCNIDWYFTYLKERTQLKIETFYIENMKFIHYSNDFFVKPIGSGLYHWKNGKLCFPLLYYGMGIEELGEFNIAQDIMKFDININDEEAKDFFTYYAKDGRNLSEYGSWNDIVNSQICNMKQEVFLKKNNINLNEKLEIVAFGAGNCLKANINKILKMYDLKYVCDNDERKWGKKIDDTIQCISPDDLRSMEKVLVVIMVYSKNIAKEIASQLDEMGITKYDYIENWIKCVE